jgi:malonate-semialdehyde dehydrogenase (acetylating) / methylmalonate-semialdehyde dehydrogenase
MLRTSVLARRSAPTLSKNASFKPCLSISTRHLQTSSTSLAAAAAKEDYIKHHSQVTKATETFNFVNNQFVKSATNRWIDLHDPATQNVVTRVPETTSEEMLAAVDAAEKAFKTWKNTSLLTRQQIMFRLAYLIRENMDRLAASITLEQGKTFADAKGDVLRGLQVVEATTAIPSQMMGEQLEVSADMDTHTIRVPLGVVAAICPFNFPAMIPLWVLPVAVATGNTLILKPSERDPGAAMIIAELAKQAGLPDGVFNIIHGTTKTVDFILDEPRIKAISFVGSDRAGKYIYTRGTANGKRVQANLGAKNHGIIMPDANKNHTLNALAGAAFGAAGQRCMALSTVVFVGETRNWLPELVERAKNLKVDGGFEEGADLGPLITPQAKARVEKLIQSGVDEGATLALDGRGFKPAKYPNGNFVAPTVYCSLRSD